MKKVFIILCACLATALCAWAAWPGQEAESHEHHLCSASEVSSCEVVSEPTTAGETWVKVSDDCNKCKMTDLERVCGKNNCGGFMAAVDGTGSYEGSYLKYDYKCNKCGHTITYKTKYK